MSAHFKPVIVILAAGNSHRFKGIKLLASVTYNKRTYTMLNLAIDKLSNLGFPLIVATGSNHNLLSERLYHKVDLHCCSKASDGFGYTIAQITNYVEAAYQKSTHILFVLADQVAISEYDFSTLLTAAKHLVSHIIYSRTAQGISAPSIFPKEFWPQLQSLYGDKGAKLVIKNNIDKSHPVDVENASIDIDLQEELIQWNAEIS